MIDEETRRKLRELSMGEMVEALDLQDSDRTTMAVPFVYGKVILDSLACRNSTLWQRTCRP